MQPLAWFALAAASTITRPAAAGAPAQPAPRVPDPGDTVALTKLDLEALTNIEVSVPAKVAQPVREAPSVGAVVTREQLQSYGWLTLDDVLFRQPGFFPAQDYERVTVASRGLYESWNNNHLLMLVDGVPINNLSNGTAYTWDVLPLFMVERAEVFRGPGSALYGTNATNGVVALDTRSVSRAQPIEASVRLGNAGTQIYDVFAGQRFTFASISLGYYHFRTDGNRYESPDGSGRTTATGELMTFATRDQRRDHFVFAKIEGEGALKGLALQAHYQYWSFETGHGWLYVAPGADERAINSEARLWLTYHAPPLLAERVELECTVLLQKHVKDYRIKFLPDGARLTIMGETVDYPGGIVESAHTSPLGLFTRAQAQYRPWGEMQVLLGVENQLVAVGADAEHSGNVDLNNGGSFRPFPGNELRPLRPVFEPVADHPIDNLGVFLQFASGRVFDRRLSVTLGARYDLQVVDYVASTGANAPLRHRSFHQVSPRVGLVGFPHSTLTLKAMAERAFRAPNPSELVTANSLFATSNIDGLRAEEMTTITIAGDWLPLGQLNLRGNGYYEEMQDQIAFSATRNLAANIYSRRLIGFEGEALTGVRVSEGVRLGGFANLSATRLLDETVDELTIAASDRLTWAPKLVANAGVDLAVRQFGASLQGHYQGRVHRRLSDRFSDDGTPTGFSGFRPASVEPFVTLDARVSYRATDWLRLGVQGSNLLDRRGHLIKTQDFPFDYQIEGLRLLATLELSAISSGSPSPPQATSSSP